MNVSIFMGFCEGCPIKCCREVHEEKVGIARTILRISRTFFTEETVLLYSQWSTALAIQQPPRKRGGKTKGRYMRIGTDLSKECPVKTDPTFAPTA